MKPSQRLIVQVQQFLLQQHDIKLVLPRLQNLIDSKVNLKILQTPISSADFNAQRNESHQNRYKLIMNYIECLLSSSNLDTRSIDNFMEVFLKVVNLDIDILQKNQVIRGNSFKIKEKLIFRIQQITKKTNTLNAGINKIHDKSDIISFIAIDIKNYLMSMKLISEEYESVRAVQIFTPIKIDPIYEHQHSSEEQYYEVYEPILQVLVRLRANMINLQSNVKSCKRIQIPLKSVNLLANCKNLLTQLEPFLITNKCLFNKLIFHVVTQQSQNMKLISGFYKSYLQYIKSLIYSVFKCVFLGHLFKSYNINFRKYIQQEKQKILKHINRININTKMQQFPGIKKQLQICSQNLAKIRMKVKQIQRIICFGRSNVMQAYLEQKISKKLQLLLQNKNYINKLQKLLLQSKSYIEQVFSLKQQLSDLQKNKKQIDRYVGIFTPNQKTQFKQKVNNQMYYQQNLKQEQYEAYFKAGFVLIQNRNMKISEIHQTFVHLQSMCQIQELTVQFFPKIYQLAKALKTQYLELETVLLNSYNNLLLIEEQKQIKSVQFSNKCILKVIAYLLNQKQQGLDKGAFKAGIGGEIINQDNHSSIVKELLEQIVKAQYMINTVASHKSQHHKQKLTQKDRNSQFSQRPIRQKKKINEIRLQSLKKKMEWLLILYEGSMDESILTLIIDKMDFQLTEPNNLKNIQKVKQLLNQLIKYNRQLRKVIKQIQIIKNRKSSQQDTAKKQYKLEDKDEQVQNLIEAKILKVFKERLILYEYIQVLYHDCLSIYTDLRSSKSAKYQNYDLEGTGIKLFDKNLYQYCLLCYHCLNKLTILDKQLQDANLSIKTKNYLNDEILELYSNRLHNFIKSNEVQMLNLMLALQKALEVEKDYKGKIKRWESIGQQVFGKEKIVDLLKWKQASSEIVTIQAEIEKIFLISKKKFVVLNIDDAKKIQSQCQQYIEISKQILSLNQLSELNFSKTYKVNKINQILAQIHKNIVTKQ